MRRRLNRRTFLRETGALGAGFWVTGRQSGFGQEKSPNARLRVACIGVGGRGRASLDACRGEDIVAVCDVDENPLSKAAKDFPNAKVFTDYRKMLDEVGKEVDAVTIGTPDHHHGPAAARAIVMGKHVYVEKPLAHSIDEVRKLTDLAARHRVVTQMGQQGHSGNERRRLVEAIRQGVVGNVTEVHTWTNRPIWPQGMDRPRGEDPVPKRLDWDAWLGPAPARPYKERAYHPSTWRGWWDFGTSALGDMACHLMDATYWALDLGYPSVVEAEGGPLKPESAPAWMSVRMDFPARGDRPPVRHFWYDGVRSGSPNLPPAELADSVPLGPQGFVVVGEKGRLVVLDEYAIRWKKIEKDGTVTDGGGIAVKQVLPRVPGSTGGHHREWIDAIRGGPPCLAGFDYSGPFTEAVLIGIVAFRSGKKLDWDGAAMKAAHCPEAQEFVKRQYRKGWEV